VCRRLERKMILLGVEGDALIFVNRLSDYLFVLSRFVISRNGEKEESWSK
jgi:cob(I)alamin adenosyltransferase